MRITMNGLRASLILALALLLTACTTFTTLDTEQVMGTSTQGLRQVSEKVFASGQPSKEQLTRMRDAGIKNVISLRPESELDWDEGRFVSELGMTYHSVPVAGADDINDTNSTSLQAVLSAIGDESVLVHCSSGNRVGALIALHQYTTKNQSPEVSIIEGRRWGLNKLEPKVRSILSATKGEL